MFRILCDPSSGSTELCLTGIIRSDSQIFCVCVQYGRLASRPYRTNTHHRFKITLPNTDQAHQNICESLQVISVKHSSVLPHDGSRKI